LEVQETALHKLASSEAAEKTELFKCTATAHPNIALVKYWGRRDSMLNLPSTGSISVTLNHLITTTTVVFNPQLEHDVLLLNGTRASAPQEDRVSKFIDIFRREAGLASFAQVVSENNFPMEIGLASSAAAFAALTLATAGALQRQYSIPRLSELARRGSSSAARSIFGGFVEMKPGQNPEGSDAVAVPLYARDYWPLEILIFITTETKKNVASSEGMIRSALTSPYYQSWLDTNPNDLELIRGALERKDFQLLGEITELNCLKMHGLIMTANPGIIYWNHVTVSLIHEVQRLRKEGIPAYFTIDAGPQVKVFCPKSFTPKIKKELSHIPGIKQILTCGIGPGATVVVPHTKKPFWKKVSKIQKIFSKK